MQRASGERRLAVSAGAAYGSQLAAYGLAVRDRTVSGPGREASVGGVGEGGEGEGASQKAKCRMRSAR